VLQSFSYHAATGELRSRIVPVYHRESPRTTRRSGCAESSCFQYYSRPAPVKRPYLCIVDRFHMIYAHDFLDESCSRLTRFYW
jgi:hypothetical protein